MTQDQPGRARGTGDLVRGEVVPDDETEATRDEESGPVTPFKRVASALRGDGPDQAAGDWVGAGDDPNLVGDEQAWDPTRPNDVSAVRRPDAGSRDWDDEATHRLGDFGDIAFGNLLPDAEQYTARWQHIQFRFVDDPQASVTEAADVVSQVTARLEAAIQERQRAIDERQRAIQQRASALRDRWGEDADADTETLRETLRMYRAFMDQLIGPRP